MSYRDRIDQHGPKRLLALDGGGLRGVISLEVLAELEAQCRRATGRADLVLADVFDYVGGTSTGAIIATAIALGREVDEILDLYCERGAEMFDRARLRDRAHHFYTDEPLEQILRSVVGADTRFGSDELETLLLIVLRNATTDSPWPLSNNPGARFNDPASAASALHLPLWQLVRASTAAPLFFPPERLRFGDDEFLFVDGAITPFNNPAFQLFLMATVEEYGLCWPAGTEDLLLVSVGTGNTPRPDWDLTERDMHLGYHAAAIPLALLGSSVAYQDLLCRVFGTCRWGGPLDVEVGDLRATRPIAGNDLFSYVRYDTPLTRKRLDALGLDDVRPEDVLPMDAVEHIDQLRRVGQALAADAVDVAHLDGFLGEAMT